jgi:UDP-2,4-diacetamido-2,4,6-trideoxy-beta-L-altropyranose hydrolase
MLRVAILADASIGIGTGHIMRMLTLSLSLREYANIVFLSRNLEGNLFALVEEKGYKQQIIDSLEVDVEGFDFLIIDHYGVNFVLQQAYKVQLPTMVVDDLFNTTSSHLLLNHNLYATDEAYKNLIDRDAICCTGAPYALVQQKFLNLPKVEKKEHILITLGGSDSENITQKVIELLLKQGCTEKLVVVLGASNPHFKKLAHLRCAQIVIIQGVDNIEMLMAQAHFAITAGGTTTLETLASKTASIVIEVADNQKEIVSYLKANALAMTYHKDELNQKEFVFDFPNPLTDTINMSKNIDKLISKVRYLSYKHARIHLANPEDIASVFELSNDSLVRQNSLNTNLISFEMHRRWYTKIIEDKSCLFLLFKSASNQLLGQIRFSNLDADETLIGLSLAPEARGVGVSKFFLESAIKYYHKHGYSNKITAQIRYQNSASLALFRGVGFEDVYKNKEVIWLHFNV